MASEFDTTALFRASNNCLQVRWVLNKECVCRDQGARNLVHPTNLVELTNCITRPSTDQEPPGRLRADKRDNERDVAKDAEEEGKMHPIFGDKHEVEASYDHGQGVKDVDDRERSRFVLLARALRKPNIRHAVLNL